MHIKKSVGKQIISNFLQKKVVAKQSCHSQGQLPIFDTFLFQILGGAIL